jgi:hypothetical protein
MKYYAPQSYLILDYGIEQLQILLEIFSTIFVETVTHFRRRLGVSSIS